MVNATAGHEILSFMDAYSGYNQIPMHPTDEEHTSFITDRGLYCYKLGKSMEVYVDDMLVKSARANQHIDHLGEMFGVLRKYHMKLNPQKCAFGVGSRKFLGFMATNKCVPFFDALKGSRRFEWTPQCEEAFQKLKEHLGKPPVLSKPHPNEELSLYLSVSQHAISSMLIREEERVQLPIYYVNKRLLDAESRYTEMERLALALMGQALAEFSHRLAPAEPEEIESTEWKLYVDGASSDNGSGADVLLISPEGHKITSAVRFKFKASNNEAEYEALIAGLRLASHLKIERLSIFNDSQLVVGQVKEQFQARGKKMGAYLRKRHEFQRFFLPIALREVLLIEQGLKLLQYATIPRAPPENLTSILSPWPFAKWGVDLIGPLHLAPGGFKFAIVAVDYYTKWAEAKALTTTTKAACTNFMWNDIVCRFGVPHSIVSDNGKQFDNASTRRFCDSVGIRKDFSAPIHPQSNGQVEAVNKILKYTLKKKLDNLKGKWAEELPKVLWAYRTTSRSTTGETPFSMAYGVEAVLPIEIKTPTLRTVVYNGDGNT
ncbi:uncharacterized protein LOC112092393 [Morus notabilis]|uniref:uncharacterized protein LOC112092393 n=1 Tax=Morus notabilis TaxID=981085 RepID=UPI000CED4F37|nr:uncharacterized protein LOC112092393 [Morus notabilis]